jgi:HSP20 family protein
MANIEKWRGNKSVWNPLREFSSLQRNIDRLFEDFLTPISGSFERDQRQLMAFEPRVDVEETDTHYLLSFDLPGISKDDVKIELRDNQLTICGERKEERTEGKGRFLQERYYGQFQRSFTLPSNVDSERVEASYQNGVLYLAIPKSEASQPKVIPIGEKRGGFFDRILGKIEEKKEQLTEKKEKTA